MTDPALLKLELATRGLRLDESARALLSGSGEVPAVVELRLADDARVAVPAAVEAPTDSPFVLASEAGRYVLRRHDGMAPERLIVEPQPPPRFYRRRTTAGTPMWRIATVQGRSLVVNPSAACGFSVSGTPCPFCVEGARAVDPEGLPAVAEVIEVVRAAFDESAGDLVLFNGPFANGEDGGIGLLVPYVEGVRRHFDTLVAAQVHPPRTDRWIERAYALGIDALSFNLELFDAEALRRHCVGRARYIGRDRYLSALAYAATIFPRGTVWSDLVVGLEPTETTMAGIDALTAMGVVPVVSAVRRPGGSGGARLPDAAALHAVLAHLYRSARRHGLTTRWLRDLAVGVGPFDARHVAGDTAPLATAIERVSRSRVGALATRGLARFRRRLRVQTHDPDAGHH